MSEKKKKKNQEENHCTSIIICGTVKELVGKWLENTLYCSIHGNVKEAQ